MKISSTILGRHLHDAAIEQLTKDLGGKGYEVQRKTPIGHAEPPFRADLIARRGADTIVYEVKVLGDRSHANLGRAAQAARDMGAQFRLVVVRPQRQIGIEIEGMPELVLRAFRDQEPAALAQGAEHLGDGWHVVQITDVELDAVAWRDDGIEVSGSAVAKLEGPDRDAPGLAPVTFALRLDAERRFTRTPSLAIDASDLDV